MIHWFIEFVLTIKRVAACSIRFDSIGDGVAENVNQSNDKKDIAGRIEEGDVDVDVDVNGIQERNDNG